MPNINLEEIFLYSGSHQPNGKFCVMELSAKLAGEEWSDHPKCVSPVIAQFCRSWNDGLPDVDRQKLKPYALKVLNTNGTYEREERRAWMATDWLCRTLLPEFLRLTESLQNIANDIAESPEIIDSKSAKQIQPKLATARDAAREIAWETDSNDDVAWDIAWDIAWNTAMDAARIAARAAEASVKDSVALKSADWSADWSSAGNKAGDAAWYAARIAARALVIPTVEKLQISAFGLLDRMIALSANE